MKPNVIRYENNFQGVKANFVPDIIYYIPLSLAPRASSPNLGEQFRLYVCYKFYYLNCSPAKGSCPKD